MPYANLEPAVTGWIPTSTRSSQSEVRRIAILLFDGFSLLGAGIVAEVFHMANELSSAKGRAECTYDVRFLSVEGGNVACSSSVRVWTDGLDARHYGGFDALFVAGGKGADDAAGDERIIEWVRRVHSKTTVVKSISEGRKVLDAAGIGNAHETHARYGSLDDPRRARRTGERSGRPLRIDEGRAPDREARPGAATYRAAWRSG